MEQNIRKRGSKAVKSIVLNIIRYLFFISFCFVILYPFIYMIIGSFKSVTDNLDPMVNWVPSGLNFGNYIDAIKVLDFKNSLYNTLLYGIVSALLQFCSCAVAAYGLARYEFTGRKILYLVLILNILVPSMMIITPSYLNFSYADVLGILKGISTLVGKELRPNLTESVGIFWIPSIFGVGLKGGLFIYIFSQFYKGLPKELEEAAWIDGAGPIRTFISIVVPSSGAAAITVLLFSIVWHWNDYYLSQMYASTTPTLSVALRNLTVETISNTMGGGSALANMSLAGILLAGCVLMVAPLIIFYVLIQRKFIASVATSGIVG